MRYPNGCHAAGANNFKIILTANGCSVVPQPRPSRRRPLPDRVGCYRPSYLTIGWHRSMSAVRLRSMTMALTAPPSWQILTRRFYRRLRS